MSDNVKTSADAYRLIHSGLAGWIESAIGEGFEEDPMNKSQGALWVDELLTLASRMRAIEGHTDLEETPND